MEPELPFALREKAFLELNETSENLQDGIAKLRKLIQNEPNLRCKTDTQFLLKFLRARKFDTDRAFQLLKQYFTVRKNNPALFSDLLPSKHSKLLDMGAQAVLNERDANGSKIYVFRLKNCDMTAITVEDIFKTNLIALEILSLEPETQIAGMTALIDLNGFTVKQHLKLLSPYIAKWSINLIQESFPLRFCAFHVINQPIYFDAIFATIKPFMKRKLKKRIHFHGANMTSLYENFNKDLLPVEYGGNQILDTSAWKNRLLSKESMFKEMEEYGYKMDS
ncbi:alpha-tocopherol transfer protein-like [Planococcus citri]|uniref:alpha-tocopherol transfer protein-like n=1 Tax=Planococcus citri TaxID=170843 RepID=UPI0031F85226